ncbi:hypothetical protein BDQ12DRAFT_648979 [Crucibulum laeve]|uniref:Monooxygenase n=1 Tax=Crucibulum laeve TaxID=68775 RepID=A0A5C3M4W2_9AGAR|nr:hypothetical protein BDQ12DRAFT_648979 [Crucibulum laeve]
MSRFPSSPLPSIAIIGAGFGGLATAIALKRKLGFENFTIYEKAGDLGGTWRDNVYPGCSSDVAMYLYSLSTDLNPNWNSTYGYQPEILAYLKELAVKYSILPHIVFNCNVLEASWDDSAQLYQITAQDLPLDTIRHITAQVVISAIGVLEIPKLPEIPGITKFTGPIFHSARWNSNIDLRGKRVAVIGNGASATQFIPAISKLPGIKVTQFCRTPNWYLPPVQIPISPVMRWAFEHASGAMRLYRFCLYLKTEIAYLFVFSSDKLRRLATKWVRRYMTRVTPKQYHDKIFPSYPLGCKRMLFDTGYLPALHRPSLELNFDGISAIDETSILTAKGKSPLSERLAFDAIITGTGFIVHKYPINIRGRHSVSVQEYYDSAGGPTAYLGTSLPGFPNFCMISAGPNTVTGHTSLLFTEEIQINYIIQLVKSIVDGNISSFEVTTKATEAYNDKIQARLSKSVFMHCISWYRLGGEGRVTSMFPGPGMLFWWWLRRPQWNHYMIIGLDRWK